MSARRRRARCARIPRPPPSEKDGRREREREGESERKRSSPLAPPENTLMDSKSVLNCILMTAMLLRALLPGVEQCSCARDDESMMDQRIEMPPLGNLERATSIDNYATRNETHSTRRFALRKRNLKGEIKRATSRAESSIY